VELGEFTAIISPTTGSTDTSKTWVSTWTRDKEPLVTFGTGYNNMEIVNGNIGIAHRFVKRCVDIHRAHRYARFRI